VREGRPFLALAAAETLSLSGTRLSTIAIPWLVLSATGSPVLTGLTAMMEMLPYVLAKALGGPLIDRIGAKRVMYIGIVGAIVLAYPYFLILNTGVFPVIVIASMVLFAFAWSTGSAGHSVLMPALFKTEFRAAGLFSSRELQGAVIAGPSPFIAVALAAALAAYGASFKWKEGPIHALLGIALGLVGWALWLHDGDDGKQTRSTAPTVQQQNQGR